MGVTDVVAVFRADTSDVTAKLGALDAQMDKVSKSGGGSMEKLATVGKAAMLALGAGAVAVGVAATDLAAKYQTSTAAVAASAGISVAAAGKITSAFLDTAGKTIYSGEQISTAYAAVAGQLGATQGKALNASQAMGVMKAAMDLAEGSGTDLGTATSILASTMQAFHDKASDAGNVSDVLFNTSRVLGTGVASVGGEFSKLHSTLGAVTPSLGDLGGLLIDMTEHGETGRKALSAVNTSLNGLLTPTAAASAAQATLGVNFENSSGQFVGMSGVIAQLQPKLETMTQSQQLLALKTIGMGTANKAMLTTILSGPAAFEAATKAASKHGTAEAAAAEQSKTLDHQIETIKAQAEDYAVKLGQKLIPMLESFAKVTANVIEWIGKHKVVLIALAVIIGGVLMVAIGAWIAGVISAGLASLAAIAPATAFGAAMSGAALAVDSSILPIILIIAVIAALIAVVIEVIKHWSAITALFKKVWDDVKKVFDTAVHDVVDIIKGWWPLILIVLTGGVALLPVLILKYWDKIRQDASDLIDDVASFFGALPGRIVTALGDIVGTIWGALTGTVAWIVTNVSTPLLAWFTGLPAKAVTALGSIVGTIWGALTGSVAWIVTNVGDPIVSYFTGLPAKIVTGLGNIVGTVFGALSGAWTWIQNNVYDPIVNGFKALPGDIGSAITSAASGALGVFAGVGKAIVNGVISGINTVIDTIDSFLDGISAFGIHPFSGKIIPDIPHLAAGGIVNSPTLALIGEAGPEAVVPLSGANAPSAAGSAPQITINGFDLSDPHATAAQIGWLLR